MSHIHDYSIEIINTVRNIDVYLDDSEADANLHIVINRSSDPTSTLPFLVRSSLTFSDYEYELFAYVSHSALSTLESIKYLVDVTSLLKNAQTDTVVSKNNPDDPAYTQLRVDVAHAIYDALVSTP